MPVLNSVCPLLQSPISVVTCSLSFADLIDAYQCSCRCRTREQSNGMDVVAEVTLQVNGLETRSALAYAARGPVPGSDACFRNRSYVNRHNICITLEEAALAIAPDSICCVPLHHASSHKLSSSRYRQQRSGALRLRRDKARALYADAGSEGREGDCV